MESCYEMRKPREEGRIADSDKEKTKINGMLAPKKKE